MDPTVFKLNRKPSHKDIKMSLIVAVANWDWKEQKRLYLLLNSLYPIQPTIHTIPQLYNCLQIYTKYTNIYMLYVLHIATIYLDTSYITMYSDISYTEALCTACIFHSPYP